MLYYIISDYHAIQYNIMLYHMIWNYMKIYYVISYYIISYHILFYHTIVYCDISYNFIPYSSASQQLPLHFLLFSEWRVAVLGKSSSFSSCFARPERKVPTPRWGGKMLTKCYSFESVRITGFQPVFLVWFLHDSYQSILVKWILLLFRHWRQGHLST